MDPAKAETKRRPVANEIVSTEEAYVASLQVLIDLYLVPLRELSLTSDAILTPAEINTLFRNIESIALLHLKFLADMQARRNEWQDAPTQCIADLFLNFAPFFKTYTAYVNDHDDATEILTQLLKSSGKRAERFQNFERQCRNHPRAKGEMLSSFLIMPIQRVPRYRLLLGELCKHTVPEHPDFDGLKKALALVHRVAGGSDVCVCHVAAV